MKVAATLNTSVEFLVTGRRSQNKSDHSRTVRLLEEAIENLQKDR